MSKWLLLASICLICGTCIGGGMLALPVSTGISGFFPSTLMMILCWAGMTVSSLLLLEANLWLKEGAHVITMASTFLGPIGRIVAWIVYLFISYASLVAYTAAGGSLFVGGIQAVIGMEVSKEIACMSFILIFGGLIYCGEKILGRVNTILVVSMVGAYVALVGTAAPEVNLHNIKHTYWPSSFLAIPLLLTTFSFQTMLPSLTPYLKRNAQSLRWAIVGGTTLTLIVYVIWQFIVLGVVPVHGPNSLIHALEAGEPITQFLREHIKSSFVSAIAEFFAFLALITSFLGIGLGLFDFLADGLKITKKGWGNVTLGLLIVIPVFIFAVYFDRIFMLALETSGGFGDAILNGMMPVLMVWVGRYVMKLPSNYTVFGGKPVLIGTFLFFFAVLVLEVITQNGLICSLSDSCKIFIQEKSLNLS